MQCQKHFPRFTYPWSNRRGLNRFLEATLIVVSLVFLIDGPLSAKQSDGITTIQRERLNAIAIRDVPDAAPGIATGIVLNGKVAYSKCAGLEDLPKNNPITPISRFNIASNGKQFTALAIIKLEADGKLSYLDDIRKFFPKLYSNVQAPITIEHLLTHTSGIRDVYDLWSLKGMTWWEHEFNNNDAIKLLQKQEDLNFAPGTNYLYSNSNYILLAEIVSKVAEIHFVDYTNEMFRQLKMPNTSFVRDHNDIREPIAKPYFNFDTWKGYDWIWNIHGDGNVFSTLEDQLQWECIVQGSGETDFDRDLILKSQRLVNRKLSKKYGFGLEFGGDDGLKTRFHAGGTGAWKAYTLRFPEKSISIVTLSNSGKTDPASQSRLMADTLLDQTGDSPAIQTKPEKIGNPVTIDEILGTYLTESDFAFRFVQAGGKLFLRRDGRSDVQLERESANIFHQTTDPAFKQEFTKLATGEMQVTAYYSTHAPFTLTRADIDWTNFDFQGLNGSFSNSETGVDFSIRHENDQKFKIEIGDEIRDARMVTTNKLISGNYTIEWYGTSKNAKTLFLSGARIRKVKFERKSDDQAKSHKRR